MDHKFLQRIPITIITLVSKDMLGCMGSRHKQCTEPCVHTHTSLADSVRQQLSKQPGNLLHQSSACNRASHCLSWRI